MSQPPTPVQPPAPAATAAPAAPPTPPVAKLSEMDQRDLDTLHRILKQRASQPNIILANEFRRYEPLFNYLSRFTGGRAPEKDELDSKLQALADEFQFRINFFVPTHVVRSMQPEDLETPVLRLPQLLTPFRTMAPTDANVSVVNSNYAHLWSDIPKVWSTAENQMSHAVLREQTHPEQIQIVAAARRNTAAIMAEIQKLYQPEGATAAAAEEAAAAPLLPGNGFEDE